MSPLIDQAVEFLAERAKAREAKTALARRVYFRAILMGESPPGGAQTLADAVEHLDLGRYDLSNDAHYFALRLTSHKDLEALHQKTRELLAAAREECPLWEQGDRLPSGKQWGPNVLAAETHLASLREVEDRLRSRAEQARLLAPRVFSPDARKFAEWSMDPPKAVEAPPHADEENNPDIEIADQENYEDFTEDSVESQPDLTASESTNPNSPVPELQVTPSHQAPPPAQYAW